MSEIIVFTDGAAKGNPGPGGWGAIIASAADVKELGGREDHTTNNRMELRAALEALMQAKHFADAPINLYTDSSYVVNGATKWGAGWKRNGWITKDKKQVLNRDLWEPFLTFVESFDGRISWHNVGGHIGIAGNERVDTIADSFAVGRQVDLYSGSRLLYRIDLADLSFDAEKYAARSASRTRSKQKAYSYVSAVDGDVQVHPTWDECKARVQGKKARYKKALSPAEEAEIIRQFST